MGIGFNLSQSELFFFFPFFYRSFNVRSATSSDLPGVQMLTETLSLNERILNDFRIFTLLRRDPVSIACKDTYRRMDKHW